MHLIANGSFEVALATSFITGLKPSLQSVYLTEQGAGSIREEQK